MSKILLIDDDYVLTESIQDALQDDNFIADVANSPADALAMLDGFVYDLIIMDWVMPDMHGIELLAMLRKKGLTTPVIMLTGMSLVDNKVQGLETGADDYLTKPFAMKELISRVRALLRRPKTLVSSELSRSGVVIDVKSSRVSWHGKELKLTKQEFQLLEFLMRHHDEVFSHDALVERAWSSWSEASPDAVRMHMSRLRKKFDNNSDACPIRTVHGKGYMFASG